MILATVAVLVLSTSQIYMWKDQVQQWQIMDTQIKMLNRLLELKNAAPFVYEDEMPENYRKVDKQDI